MDKEWLVSLNVGDTVCITGNRPGNSKRKSIVKRITKTMIIVGNSRFRIHSGYSVGDGSYGTLFIRPWTEVDDNREHRHELYVRARNAFEYLEKRRAGDVDTDKLGKVFRPMIELAREMREAAKGENDL